MVYPTAAQLDRVFGERWNELRGGLRGYYY
jgi:hypothetical protein